MLEFRRALIGACFALGACATTGAPPPAAKAGPSAAEYAPLAVGAAWTYQMDYLGQTGEMTVKLTGMKDGYFVDDHNGALRVTPDGLRDRDRFLLREPLVAGTTWKTVVSASAVEHAEIESVGKPCASVAGSFQDCVVVKGWMRRDKDRTLHIRWTWAKNIGLVKVETDAELNGKGRVPVARQSLKLYSLNPKPAAEPQAQAQDSAPAKAPQAKKGGEGEWTTE